MNSSVSLRLGAIVAATAAVFAFSSAPSMAAPTNGANSGSCVYTPPTGVGEPSGNGVATTQPAAGTKGKADSKCPPGQEPDGATDGNAGYECDTNQGVGQTNPAHTGCTPTEPPPSGS
jgi:hypothetical protein